MTELLREQRQRSEEEASSLKGKISRLRSVQREVLDAGMQRGRKILYWDWVKGDGGESSLTWRSAGEELREARPPQSPAHPRTSRALPHPHRRLADLPGEAAP